MIEKVLISYLNNALDVPVYGEEPKKKTKKYCILQTIDAGYTNFICKATVMIRSYAPSLQEAEELYSQVKEAMYNSGQIDNISSGKLAGGGQAIDVTTDRYAYDCVFNIFYMEG